MNDPQDNPPTPLNHIVKRHMSVRSKMVSRRLRKYLLAGVLVTAPIAITLYLAYIFIAFIDAKVAAILGLPPGQGLFPGSGLVISILFFIAMGWLATNLLGQMFINISNYIMEHVPVLKTLYNTVKQIVEMLLGSQAKAFREVVMIEYPRAGSWTIGFVTGMPEGEVKLGASGEELVTVFVPTAPSPVNGFMLFVPRSEAKKMNMSVDEGIKMIVSMGLISPPSCMPATLPEHMDKAS